MHLEYDAAQICLNGHLINEASINHGYANKNYCPQCGTETIIACTSCGKQIPGAIKIGKHSYGKVELIPKYCEGCGIAYPWTDRSKKAADEFIELSELETEDKIDLKASVADLIEGGPRTSLATIKIKKYIGKAGTVLGNGLKDILTDVLSEAVKKAIWSS